MVHYLSSGKLGQLALARIELSPIPKGSRAAGDPSSRFLSIEPASPSSGPSPLPAPTPPSPSPAPEDDLPAATATPPPPQDRLPFNFGGYGGVHYSPDGYIIGRSAPATAIDVAEDDDEMSSLPELEYPPSDSEAEHELMHLVAQATRALDLTVPVCIVAWDNAESEPVHIFAHPRVNNPAPSGFRVGEILLRDYEAVFLRAGFNV
ncbi:hypothetical protein B0H13DRAFT_2305388 [Mycena leptocephala]|nr:hypothetical protein B0H13DRAFT_2305388 [Mycena leptocephala]